ncbi:hypothetical protein B0I35DRAFT_474222 [Stachybotrys elegans]|uniref:Uncharacterized protein n=1 Tax=Stachybotrys elegans TaxID=80388 RepID=A0A8K0T3P1_9HYPO|nr:hypothetical protein B0I35DRAFT_474222 [Stachybotrys elegans]
MTSRMPLYISLGLLMVVSIIELSFVSSTVGFLHGTASGNFQFLWNNAAFYLNGKPKNFLLDQGHTSNAASGTAFILVGCGGIVALWITSKSKPSRFGLLYYYTWVLINILSLCLTLGALIYVFVVTNNHNGQRIDQAMAARLDGDPYDLDTWTPQNWFSAVLKLDLLDDRGVISRNYHVMRGWQFNLIPFFIIQFFETGLALMDAQAKRKAWNSPIGKEDFRDKESIGQRS